MASIQQSVANLIGSVNEMTNGLTEQIPHLKTALFQAQSLLSSDEFDKNELIKALADAQSAADDLESQVRAINAVEPPQAAEQAQEAPQEDQSPEEAPEAAPEAPEATKTTRRRKS